MLDKFPLRREAEFGVFLWWPGDDDKWIHPHDVPKAKEIIPGNRVFRRDDFDDTYNLLTYGEYEIRIRPAMWLPVKTDGFDLGDAIEVKSNFGQTRPFIGTIEDMFWHRNEKVIEYLINKSGNVLPKRYRAFELQAVDRLNRVPVRPSLRIKKKEERPIEV